MVWGNFVLTSLHIVLLGFIFLVLLHPEVTLHFACLTEMLITSVSVYLISRPFRFPVSSTWVNGKDRSPGRLWRILDCYIFPNLLSCVLMGFQSFSWKLERQLDGAFLSCHVTSGCFPLVIVSLIVLTFFYFSLQK